MVLSMDNIHSLDSIIAEVKAQYKDTANYGWAETKTTYQIKYEDLQTLTGKHGYDLYYRKMEIS